MPAAFVTGPRVFAGRFGRSVTLYAFVICSVRVSNSIQYLIDRSSGFAVASPGCVPGGNGPELTVSHHLVARLVSRLYPMDRANAP